MARTLKPGGPTADLPDNWKAPWGWPRSGNVNALWVGTEACTKEQLAELEGMGWTADPMTLVGIHDARWDAIQYASQREEIQQLEPGEWVPRPGGEGSWAYMSQHLPEEVDNVLTRRKATWVYLLDGSLVKNRKETIPVELVDKGDAHRDWHELDMKVIWDSARKLWQKV